MMDAGNAMADDELERLDRRVRAVYAQAYSETKEKLSGYLKAFDAKNAAKLDLVASGGISRDEYQRWRTGQVLIGERWKEMLDVISEDYVNADRIAAGIINGAAKDVYALGHNYGTFEVEKGSLVDTSYTLYDRDTVSRLLRDEPDLLPQAKVDAKKSKAWNRQKITSAVTQGVIQGESAAQVAERLKTVAGMDAGSAIRSARTALTGSENAGRLDSWRRAKKMGINVRKEWISTLDPLTRASHRHLDGEVRDIEDRFSNGLMYPGDPSGMGEEVYNCRCAMVANFADVDVTANKPYSSPKMQGMTYDEWKGTKEPPYTPPVTADTSSMHFDNFRNLMGKEWMEGFDRIVDGAQERDAAEFFKRYGGSMSVENPWETSGAWFDPNDMGVSFDMDAVRIGDMLHRPYETAFHEFGHNLDYALEPQDDFYLSSGNGFKLFRSMSDDWKRFKDSTYDEYMHGTPEQFRAITGKPISAWFMDYNVEYELKKAGVSKGVIDEIRTMGQTPRFKDADYFGSPYFGMVRDIVESLVPDKNQAVVNVLKWERRPISEVGNLSDALEAVTGIDYPLGAGHGASYHTMKNASTEFFAEVLGAKMCNQESLVQLRRVMPSAVAEVERILQEKLS